MRATYVQKGEDLYYTAGENVSLGSVVSLGTRIGVAAAGIPAGETGAVQVEGVFRLAKAAGTAISMGTAVFYDETADVITTAEGGIPAGYAAAPVAESDATVLVKLLG